MAIRSYVEITCDALIPIDDDREARCNSGIGADSAHKAVEMALAEGWRLNEHFKTVPIVGRLHRDLCPQCQKRMVVDAVT